jgi:predicted RNase H-like nuclease (RuvC/YqgF family)
MVDRVYKNDIPELRRKLENLQDEFESLRPKTNWTKLRIEPLISHAGSLQRLLESEEFSGEVARLKRGVAMFHSDLVYLRTNVKELKKLLETAKSAASS